MDTNEPGREPTEPTEPTDAELLRDFEAADVRLNDACENCMDFNEDGEPTDPEYIAAQDEWTHAHARREIRGKEYLSGQRPMPGSEVSRAEVLRMSTDTLLKAEAERLPDTPAPDEVAQLRAEVLRVTHAYEQVCMGIQKLRDAADLSTARVAELEALLAWLLWHQQGGHSVFGQPIRKALGLGQFERMPDAVIDIAKQFETTQPGPLEHTEAAPGKEPTSE